MLGNAQIYIAKLYSIKQGNSKSSFTMFWILHLWIFLIITTSSTFASTYKCFEDRVSYQCRLGAITPYRFVANTDDSELHFPGCTEKKIWLLSRHGTRNPSKKYIPLMTTILPQLKRTILDNYAKNKTRLRNRDIARLSQWHFNMSLNKASKLVKEGENEMIDLGERYQARFPSLMPEMYSNQTYKFRFTATQRTEESAKHFTVGLFGWRNSKNVRFPEPLQEDLVLRHYKYCKRWRKEVDKNPDAIQEKIDFINSKIVNKTLKAISKRIGSQIDYETAHLMRTMCAFETSWDKDNDSPWCHMLSIDDFKVLEFAEDLEYYWIDGYGFQLTSDQACPALTNMFKFFEAKDPQKVSAYFTHSGAILKLLALLGLAKDPDPLKHISYATYGNTRFWRTSLIDAFASNIAFILYECEFDEPKILVMHQERVVQLPGCPIDTICPMSVMKAIYPDKDEECPFDAMCSL